MKRLVLLFFLFLSCSSFAQFDEYLEPKKGERIKKFGVKLTPQRIFAFINPAVPIGFEWNHSDRFFTEVTASILLRESIDYRGINQPYNIRGYRIAVEEKYVLNHTDGPAHPYVGLELDYLSNRYDDIDFRVPKDSFASGWHEPFVYEDSISVRKQFLNINAKVGIRVPLGRFYFDGYIGLGVRLKNTIVYEQRNAEDFTYSGRHPSPWHFFNEKGFNVRPNIPMNVRLGYWF